MAKSVTVADVRPRDRAGPDQRPTTRSARCCPRPTAAHGAITMRHLLTMTSGLHWNGLRDYNVFTVLRPRARRADAGDRPPARHLLRVRAEPGVAAGRGDRPLRRAGTRARSPSASCSTPLGIEPGTLGLDARPRGPHRRLLRRADAHRGLRAPGRADAPRRACGRASGCCRRPTCATRSRRRRTNGCYGYLIWLNRDAPCVGPDDHRAAGGRPTREFPDLPADMYRFSGPVRPAGHRVPVAGHRGGAQRPGPGPAAHRRQRRGSTTLYRKVLAAVTDQKIPPPAPAGQRRPEGQAERRLRLPDRAGQPRPVLQGRGPGPAAARRPAAAPAPCAWGR